MEYRIIKYKNNEFKVYRYDDNDIPSILRTFFIWYTTAIISNEYNMRRPPIPEDFTEKITCYSLGLWHKIGAGPDAFLIEENENIIPIEIKATTTKSGFQGNINSENFKKLVWFDFSDFLDLKFRIFEFSSNIFENLNNRVNLKRVADDNNINQTMEGVIGVNIPQQYKILHSAISCKDES